MRPPSVSYQFVVGSTRPVIMAPVRPSHLCYHCQMQRWGPAAYRDRPVRDDESGVSEGPTASDWALFALHAVRRRKWITIGAFLFGVGATVLYYATRVPMYHVETVVTARRQQSVSSVVRPTVGDDQPTRLAWELVHRRENLIELVKQTGMAPDPHSTKKAGLTDWLAHFVSRSSSNSESHDDPVGGLVLMLDKALLVTTSDGTVKIAIDWPEPREAYRLVEAALQNFLEARHVQEITAIDEVISLVQGQVAALRVQMDKAIEEAQRELAGGADGSRQASARRGQVSEELVRLKSLLDAKQRAIADVEDFRRRRLAELQSQLDERLAMYSNAHPVVVNLRQDIQALSRESPQIVTLREEEQKLRGDYAARLAQEGRPPDAEPGPSRAALVGTARSIEQNERVREMRIQYQQMVERLSSARLDLDAARAAFKYRYNVVWPAQMPTEPESPKPLKILGLGTFCAMLLSLLAAMAPDLLRGRVTERWQVERSLELPIIGELPRE
jgi:uncharacterized protein involved in exopolysaccharide biosynthesis